MQFWFDLERAEEANFTSLKIAYFPSPIVTQSPSHLDRSVLQKFSNGMYIFISASRTADNDTRVAS